MHGRKSPLRSAISCSIMLCFVFTVSACAASAAENTKLTIEQVRAVAGRCAASTASDTVLAVAQTESALHPYAISLNYPAASATRAGYPGHRLTLARQPRDKQEALRWMSWFAHRGYTVSVGLMQVNIENAVLFALSPSDLFEPCVNVAVGTTLLRQLYNRAFALYRTHDRAMLAALAAYNSGSFKPGVSADYVLTVLNNASRVPIRERIPIPQENTAATRRKRR